MDKDKILDDIFKNDPLGLLNVKPSASPARSDDERLLASFDEINRFYDENGREPMSNGKVQEHILYSRLKSIREDEDKISALASEDRYGLLQRIEKKEITSLDDVLNDDTMGILASEAESIFSFKHIPKETSMPDYVAKRKPCGDFKNFESLFIACQKALTEGKRRLHPFKNEQQIEEGYFFVLKGVLLYVAEVGKRAPDENGKINARLRCIFENGTESDMLLRSLAAELYKDGRRVSEHDDHLLDGFSVITEDDKEAGYIYILKSKSEKAEIKEIENLFKIGYSNLEVKERIKNAEQEPTYLMAPVKIVTAFKCYNMNPQKLEQLLHNFFGNSCLNIDVYDQNGNRHTPREWFIAPLEVIEDAIGYIKSGEILDYCYDPDMQIIKCKQKSDD